MYLSNLFVLHHILIGQWRYIVCKWRKIMKIHSISTHIARPCIPPDYGLLGKRNFAKIDVYHNGIYQCSTTWAKSILIARSVFAQDKRIPLYTVTAKFGG